MKTIVAVAVILQVSTTLASQQPDTTSSPESARNVIYYEVLGEGLGVSLNYERLLSHEMGLHIGYTDWVTRGIPLGFHYFVGSTHTLELGAGLMIDVYRYKGVYPTGIIGYRYRPTSGGFVFGAGVTPVVGHPEAPAIIGGISLGWSF
jgi:hypothetical protein